VFYIIPVKVCFPVSCDLWNTLYDDSYSSVSLGDLHNLKFADASSTVALKKRGVGGVEETRNGRENNIQM
jgi:hypothetical protein